MKAALAISYTGLLFMHFTHKIFSSVYFETRGVPHHWHIFLDIKDIFLKQWLQNIFLLSITLLQFGHVLGNIKLIMF